MSLLVNDKQYLKIVKHILTCNNFILINQYSHHGTTRLNHSIRVSYYSYKISKILKLDYKTCATGGLLHDFYIGEEESNLIKYFKFQKSHPKIAVNNAMKLFDINYKEQNIIETHMFPLTKPAKYPEGWIVCVLDKGITIYEYFDTIKHKAVKWTKKLSRRNNN